MIDRFEASDDAENWELAQRYRQTFLDNIISDQLFMVQHGVPWLDTERMPYSDRYVVIEKLRQVDKQKAGFA